MKWLTRILDALEALRLRVERLVLSVYRPFSNLADRVFGIKRCPHCVGGHGCTLPDWWCTYLARKAEAERRQNMSHGSEAEADELVEQAGRRTDMKEVRVKILTRCGSRPPRVSDMGAGTFFTFKGRNHPYIMTTAKELGYHAQYRSLKTGRLYQSQTMADLNLHVHIVRPVELIFEDV